MERSGSVTVTCRTCCTDLLAVDQLREQIQTLTALLIEAGRCLPLGDTMPQLRARIERATTAPDAPSANGETDD